MATYSSTVRETFRTENRVKNGANPEVRTFSHRTISRANSVNTEDTKGRPWKRYIAAGLLTSSDMVVNSGEVIERSSWFCKRVQMHQTSGLVHTHLVHGDIPMDLYAFGGSSAGSDHPYTQARNQAAAAYYRSASQIQTKFKGMVFAGELRQTLQMIKRPAQSIRNLLSKHLNDVKKHRSVKDKRKRLEKVRDNWLETQYGLMPLVSDTESALDAFYSSKAIQPLAEMARGYGKASSGGELGYNNFGVPNNCTLRVVRRGFVDVQVKYYGTIRSTGSGVDKPKLYGFRAAEFVPTLWELVPWSFVVDYFSNVGQVLESWSYRSVFDGGTIETKVVDGRSEIRTVSWKPISSLIGYKDTDFDMVPGTFSSINRLLTRFPGAAPPPPTLGLRVPGMGTKWINLAALASQLSSARGALR